MQYLNRFTDFFLKDKEHLSAADLYKSKTLILITSWTWSLGVFLAFLQNFGYFTGEAVLALAVFSALFLLILKYTGNIAVIGILIAIAGTLIICYNINATGYIYSYNHKWFILILLVVNFYSNRFTFSYLVLIYILQCYFYFVTPDILQTIGSKEEHFIDNLVYFVLPYLILLIFRRMQAIQTSKIDDQNTLLLNQQKELVNKNQLLENRSELLLNSNQELERFAYIASHDLKTPLNNIISFSLLLEEELKDFDNENAQQYFQFIKDGSSKMNNLIVDVLEYSKMSSKETKKVEINLKELIESIMTDISEYINHRKATITIHNELGVIHSNTAQMYLLFKNLIENGIKYNQSTHPKIEISSTQEKEQVIFEIKDNGIGIDPKYHKNIFQMFTRLHTNREYDGTGLGLALCKKIVNGLNGKIELVSESGEGSKFIISLPNKHFIT